MRNRIGNNKDKINRLKKLWIALENYDSIIPAFWRLRGLRIKTLFDDIPKEKGHDFAKDLDLFFQKWDHEELNDLQKWTKCYMLIVHNLKTDIQLKAFDDLKINDVDRYLKDEIGTEIIEDKIFNNRFSLIVKYYLLEAIARNDKEKGGSHFEYLYELFGISDEETQDRCLEQLRDDVKQKRILLTFGRYILRKRKIKKSRLNIVPLAILKNTLVFILVIGIMLGIFFSVRKIWWDGICPSPFCSFIRHEGSNLIWNVKEAAYLPYSDAVEYIDTISPHKFRNNYTWRLPSLAEVKTISNKNEECLYVKKKFGENICEADLLTSGKEGDRVVSYNPATGKEKKVLLEEPVLVLPVSSDSSS